jgi:hypothetical protein
MSRTRAMKGSSNGFYDGDPQAAGVWAAGLIFAVQLIPPEG